MRRIFFGEGRLRSGWRVLSFIVVSLLLLLGLTILIEFGLAAYLMAQGTALDNLQERMLQILTAPPGLTFTEIMQFAITLATVYLWRRWLDKKSFRSLGVEVTPGWWQELLLGASLVGIIWTIIFVFSLTTSTASITGTRFDASSLIGGLGLGLVLNVIIGFNEELNARGYVLQNLTEGLGFTPAVVLSAAYFGALHLLNPGASAGSTLGVALFGILAALGFAATGRLWMSIGMHAAWNLFEGPVFGFRVSGLNLGGVFVLRINGPEWLTGGSFGPEAGALTMVPLLILIAALYLWGRGRKRLVN